MKCRYKEYLKKVELDNKKFIDEMYERLDVEKMAKQAETKKEPETLPQKQEQ